MGLAALPAVAVDMLEQVERAGAGPVEQVDVPLLQVERVAFRKFVDQAVKVVVQPRRKQSLGCQRPGKFAAAGRRQQRRRGIGEQARQDLVGAHHLPSSRLLPLPPR